MNEMGSLLTYLSGAPPPRPPGQARNGAPPPPTHPGRAASQTRREQRPRRDGAFPSRNWPAFAHSAAVLHLDAARTVGYFRPTHAIIRRDIAPSHRLPPFGRACHGGGQRGNGSDFRANGGGRQETDARIPHRDRELARP